MPILLLFAFLSGLVTILAPCIWPLLPIILSSSFGGSKSKSLGITLGITISFAFFTLAISYLVSIFHFDPNILRLFAVIIIGFLGLTLFIPPLSEKLETWVSQISGRLNYSPKTPKSGFWAGLITGISLGIVWTPCAGPILATIAAFAATRAVNTDIIIITIFYVLGVGIPLFFFSYGGSLLLNKTKILSPYLGIIQRIFGLIMILTALAIFTNFDKVLEVKLLDAVPSYSDFIVQIESNNAVRSQLDKLKGTKKPDDMAGKPVNQISNEGNKMLPDLGVAPNFSGITHWLNLPPGQTSLTMDQLKDKVVLIDFWTYTCINCLRTLSHVTSWYDKYKDAGFVVVGVHTPEFEFEKNTQNVENAIKQYGINYPVAQDNDYKTWNAYQNHYWPAEYLIDAKGIIRRTHFGEGEYDQMENAIKTLLEEKGASPSAGLVNMPDQTPTQQVSPETYIGSGRMEYYYPDANLKDGTQTFTLSQNIPQNTFSLAGTWMIDAEYSMAQKDAVLEYNFYADKVYLVMRPPQNAKSAAVKVYVDGKLADEKNAGIDVKNGIVTIESDRLYNLVDQKGNYSNHVLRLEFADGISVYAFTFG